MFANSAFSAMGAAFLITFAIFIAIILPFRILINDVSWKSAGMLVRSAALSSTTLTAIFVTRTARFFAQTLYPDGADFADKLLIALLTIAFISAAISAYKFFRNNIEPRLARIGMNNSGNI